MNLSSPISAARRHAPLALLGLVAIGWAVALVLQHGFDMEPCSLCILQRWALTGVGLGALVAQLAGPKRRIALLLPLLSAVAGLVVAAKHVYLQVTPHTGEGGCGMGGSLLLDHFPLTKALPALFAGSGECATLPFVLGAPLPLWVGLLFCGCLAVITAGLTKRNP